MILATIKNVDMVFETDPAVFSPRAVDAGTLAMLSVVDFGPQDKVLDLGCGYGVAGILAAKLTGAKNVILCDISEPAVTCAKVNARLNHVPDLQIRVSDGYANIEESGFTLILSNPPYHADFSIPKRFIEAGYKKLAPGGRLVMVTKRLDWYKNKLTSVFGGVTIHEIDGYYVFVAEKRKRPVKAKEESSDKLSRKLQRRQQRRKGRQRW